MSTAAELASLLIYQYKQLVTGSAKDETYTLLSSISKKIPNLTVSGRNVGTFGHIRIVPLRVYQPF